MSVDYFDITTVRAAVGEFQHSATYNSEEIREPLKGDAYRLVKNGNAENIKMLERDKTLNKIFMRAFTE